MTYARGIAGFLQIHPEIHEVDDDLDMALGLHVAAHQPKGGVRNPVPSHKGGNDGVKRPLSGFEGVGVVRVE